MATKILAAVLTLCILATQGTNIHKEDNGLLLTAMHTLLTEPEMIIDVFGPTREKRHIQGDWDFDHSFGGVTLQIKYKEPANRWKGGHAHFEVQDLSALLPHVKTSHVDFDIIFDGGDAPRDGLFSLKVEYSLQHDFEEKGIFEFSRKHIGNHWISDISNKKNGGGSGNRIFPEIEFHGKTDRSTMTTATYNSNWFKSVKLDIKKDPGKKLDGTLEGTFLGKHMKITLHGTRNSVTDKIDGTLTIEIGPKKYDFKITGESKIETGSELNVMKLTGDIEGNTLGVTFTRKSTEGTKFSNGLFLTYGPQYYRLFWGVDYTNDTKFIIKLSTRGSQVLDIKYRRTSNWDSIKFSFGNLVTLELKKEIGGTWNRKTTIYYKGEFFDDAPGFHIFQLHGVLGHIGSPGKMVLQAEEVNALTKRFTVIMDKKNETEFLKYVNTITHNTQVMHDGHQELAITMKANMHLKENSTFHSFLCEDLNSIYRPSILQMGPNGIHCFNHRETNITFNLNLDEPWHMLVLAKVNQDGSNVVDAKIDTKSQNHGEMHVHYHPGTGKDIEIDLERTHKESAGKHVHHFMGKVQRNKEVYYDYDGTVSYGGNSSQYELDANSSMTVNPNSHLNMFACSPEMSAFNFLCFSKRTMETIFRADKAEPYKMAVHSKVDKDGAEVFRIDMQTQTSPYKLTLNWPRMRAIIAPYRQGPLVLTANHNSGTSLAITSNIRGFSQFSVVKMQNNKKKVTLNNQEVFTADFWTNGRSITQNTTFPDGRTLMTTFKWGNDNNWLNNHIELDLNDTGKMLDSMFEWNFRESQGAWKLEAVGQNYGWGDYNIHRTGKYENNGGVWTFDVDGTALWKGNNVKTDIFIKLDTQKVGNGKLDAITAKLIKVVDGKTYEVNVTDGKITSGDFVKVADFFRDMSH